MLGRQASLCVNRDGVRESLGLDVVTSEDGAAWLAFLRSLVARGLAGVRLVSSDAHPGLVDAIAATLPGAAWQRCLDQLQTRFPEAAALLDEAAVDLLAFTGFPKEHWRQL